MHLAAPQVAETCISGMRGIDIAKLAMQLCGTEMRVGVATLRPCRRPRQLPQLHLLDDTAADARGKAELHPYRDRLRVGGGATPCTCR
jgi:hypothetical protein